MLSRNGSRHGSSWVLVNSGVAAISVRPYGETVEILVRFPANPGTYEEGIYLMHCHKLEHEDMGMMLNFRIV
jgi:FtsP/CotA-like multicopper oxidase with cupredoxin domain